VLIAAGGVVTGGWAHHDVVTLSIGFTVLSVAFALVLLAVSTGDAGWWRGVLEWRVLRAAGKYSYAMYVVHQLVNLLWQPLLLNTLAWTGNWRQAAYMVVVTVVSFGLAFISYHALEKHFLRMKRFFVPTDSAAAAAPARRPAIV
jgi:peptidoglycan/LPS O-acetylase OafA/YrhL